MSTLNVTTLIPSEGTNTDLSLDGKGTGNVAVVDDATVGGTLGVTGATTLSSTLGVTGATTLSSTLGVTGVATLSSDLGTAGHASVGAAGVTAATRALTVVGASDGTGSSIIVGYNSSLASKFTVRDDGYVTVGNGLAVTGALSKSSGSFKIDHPLPDKKETHNLVHSFIEGPQADLIYRGRVALANGTSTVNIDTAAGMTEGTFELLCTNVQCLTSNEDGFVAIKGSVTGNILTITAQENSCSDTVGWVVIGERCDPHMTSVGTEWTDTNGKVIVEPLKEEE